MDGLRIQLVERAGGGVVAGLEVPAKTLCEIDGRSVLVAGIGPEASADSIMAVGANIRARLDEVGLDLSKVLVLLVDSTDDVREFEFRVSLPSAEDAAAVEFFADRMHGAWRRQKVANGYADHVFLVGPGGGEFNAQGDALCARCRRVAMHHHPDMRPFSELPEANANLARAGAREFLRALSEWPGAAGGNGMDVSNTAPEVEPGAEHPA